jgi:hypothetical protein
MWTWRVIFFFLQRNKRNSVAIPNRNHNPLGRFAELLLGFGSIRSRVRAGSLTDSQQPKSLVDRVPRETLIWAAINGDRDLPCYFTAQGTQPNPPQGSKEIELSAGNAATKGRGTQDPSLCTQFCRGGRRRARIEGLRWCRRTQSLGKEDDLGCVEVGL